jgi:uncharacterized protein with GYD domain
MAKYMFSASYAPEGLKGIMKEGGTARVKAVEQAVTGLGGSLEAFYFAFGEPDAFVIVDLPDNVSASALAVAAGAAGRFSVRTTVLLTPAQVDEAVKMSVNFRPPGD